MATGKHMSAGVVSLRLARITRQFWDKVNGRLVKVHRVRKVDAQKAVAVYRSRVGDVALNRGEAETASDIAAAVREGGFRIVKVRAPKLASRSSSTPHPESRSKTKAVHAAS